jgi:hypothetical protein
MAQSPNNTDGDPISFLMNPIYILNIGSGTGPTLTLIKPAVPGDPVPAVSDSTSYLNYTTIADATASTVGNHYKINVILSKLPPTGTTLTVVARAHSGTGAGDYGDVSAVLTPDATTAQDIITGITSCYTGTGAAGSRLRYTWSVSDYTTVVSVTSSSNLTATYTVVGTL